MSSKDRGLVSAIEVITVGLPFCTFKLLTGWIAIHTPPFAPLGYALVALGAIDLALNAVNLVALLTIRRRALGVCLAEYALRALGRRTEIGLALDVLVSFGLVALVVGLGLFAKIPSDAMPLWNFAVVLNVLGAGVGRMITALGRADVTSPAPGA